MTIPVPTTPMLNAAGAPTLEWYQALKRLESQQNIGIRNLFINGDMRIDQRHCGNLQTIVAGNALAYGIDRWWVACTGANCTSGRIHGSAPSQWRYFFIGNPGVTTILFGQRISAADSYHLAGRTATLSIDIANELLSTISWTAYYASSTDTWGTLASPAKTLIATGVFATGAAISRKSAQISIPAEATTGLEIVFTLGAQTIGICTIGDVQLELGSTMSAFDRRSYYEELSRCLFFYEKSYDIETVPGTVTTSGAWNGVCINAVDYYSFGDNKFSPKRVPPTITTYSPGTGAQGYARQQGSSDVVCGASSIGQNRCRFSTSGAATNNYHQVHWTADAEMRT